MLTLGSDCFKGGRFLTSRSDKLLRTRPAGHFVPLSTVNEVRILGWPYKKLEDGKIHHQQSSNIDVISCYELMPFPSIRHLKLEYTKIVSHGATAESRRKDISSPSYPGDEKTRPLQGPMTLESITLTRSPTTPLSLKWMIENSNLKKFVYRDSKIQETRKIPFKAQDTFEELYHAASNSPEYLVVSTAGPILRESIDFPGFHNLRTLKIDFGLLGRWFIRPLDQMLPQSLEECTTFFMRNIGSRVGCSISNLFDGFDPESIPRLDGITFHFGTYDTSNAFDSVLRSL